jgi:phosphatidylglycerophosphate synthase
MISAYQPASRRPIARMFRRTAGPAVRFCVRAGIHPDAVSYSSIVASAAAAVCFWQALNCLGLLLLAPLFCYLRLWLNMLDGMVALAAGKASWRGEVLNDLPDRLSDILIFVGVAHSGLCSPYIGYWAAIFSLLTAYVGLLGQAVGVGRQFGGMMSKPWRMVTLHIGAWITLALSSRGLSRGALDLTCLLIVAGCLQTIALRLNRIFAALAAKQKDAAT